MTIDRAAYPFLLPSAALTALAGWLYPWAAPLPAAFLLFAAWFFRDPERNTPADPDAIVSPADGRIIVAGAERISVFMNVFNVHVCRTPVAGRVAAVTYRPGRFLAAFKDEAPDENERTAIAIEGRVALRFTLVAGLIARRIVCRVEPGRTLAAGERVGLIRFGSRVDVDLPPGATVSVAVGDRVVAGETVLARSSERSAAGAEPRAIGRLPV